MANFAFKQRGKHKRVADILKIKGLNLQLLNVYVYTNLSLMIGKIYYQLISLKTKRECLT